MDYLYQYLQFAAEFATAVVLLGVLPLLVLLLRKQRAPADAPTVSIVKLNERARDLHLALEASLRPPKEFKQHRNALIKAEKHSPETAENEPRKRLFVCNFYGDLRASAVRSLREEITAILSVARSTDEVVIVLESAGGTVPGYGLAASQLRRVRDRNITLTVVVDKIAASGGYLMACVAERIVAAPFAIIGSIGVVAEVPNFNRLLRKHDIDFEQITAGKHKRTLTLFGENTADGREKVQQEINDAHALFKEQILRHRPAVKIDTVATGEYWFATRALDLGLVDRLATSDEYIGEQMASADVYQVTVKIPKHWREKLFDRASSILGAR